MANDDGNLRGHRRVLAAAVLAGASLILLGAGVLAIMDPDGAAGAGDTAQSPIPPRAAVGITDSPNVPTDRVTSVRVADRQTFRALLDELGFDVSAIPDATTAVPPLYVHSQPSGYGDVADVNERKALFFSQILPLSLRVNSEIEAQRETMLALGERVADGESLSQTEREWLTDLALYYRTASRPDDLAADERFVMDPADVDFESLAVRVRPIPPALTIAQAAEESAWGMSRFAREGNAMFGQWTYDQDKMMVPRERPEDQNYGVERFERQIDAVRKYKRSLNSHPAYRGVRLLREQVIGRGQVPQGNVMAGGLENYSAREQEYIRSIRSIISYNNLTRFNQASLDPGYTDGVDLAELVDSL